LYCSLAGLATFMYFFSYTCALCQKDDDGTSSLYILDSVLLVISMFAMCVAPLSDSMKPYTLPMEMTSEEPDTTKMT